MCLTNKYPYKSKSVKKAVKKISLTCVHLRIYIYVSVCLCEQPEWWNLNRIKEWDEEGGLYCATTIRFDDWKVSNNLQDVLLQS